MKPESKVIMQRWMHKTCVKRMVRKLRKFGKVMVALTIVDNPEWTERAAVDEALREEQVKRGLR